MYPDYLKDQNSLRCPADPGKQAAAGSFEYHPPQRGGKSEPAIFCNHHGSVVLRVQAHATPADDGHTDWELRIQPRSGQQPP